MRYQADKLNSETVEYLKRIHHSRGEDSNGVFIDRPENKKTDPRIVQFLGVMAGLLFLVPVGLYYYAPQLFNFDLITLGQTQAVVSGIGIFFLLAGLFAFTRPVKRLAKSSFLWADARYLWDVAPTEINVYDLAELREANATHVHENRYYVRSDVKIRCGSGLLQFQFSLKQPAERLVLFLNLLKMTRADEQIRETGPDFDRLAAAIAMTATQRGPESLSEGIDLASLKPGLPVPTPESSKEATPNERRKTKHLTVSVLSGVAIGAIGYFLFPWVNQYLDEKQLFETATIARSGDEQPYQEYLRRYPQGGHVTQVKKSFEENLFDFATHSRPGDTTRYAKYLGTFEGNASSRLPEIFRAREENLFKYAMASSAGDDSRYVTYLKVNSSQDGARTTEIQTARENNLFEYAIDSPPGDAERYEQYLDVFGEEKRTDEVNDAWESNYYQFAVTAGMTDVDPCKLYLGKFPKSKRADEIVQLLDDRQFAVASDAAKSSESPAPLRAYLADPSNSRHRIDAQAGINVIYDKVIDQLMNRREQVQKGKVDKSLLDAIAALLKGMKHAKSPSVVVKFSATQEVEPKTDEQKKKEASLYRIHLKQRPELESLESIQGTALIKHGKVFTQEQINERQKLILQRLQAVIGKVVSPDVLRIVAQAQGAKAEAELDVAYHTFAPGNIYVYSQYERSAVDGIGGSVIKNETAKGLVRGYEVNWTVIAKPAGVATPIEFNLTSDPASQMGYDYRPGDPDWAPYAILLYSASYDMSSQLIRGFGLEPGPVPESYRFSDATGIETYTLDQLVAAIRPVLPQLQSHMERDDWNRLQNLVDEATGGFNISTLDFGEGTTKSKIEALLRKYPGVDRAVMRILEDVLEKRPY